MKRFLFHCPRLTFWCFHIWIFFSALFLFFLLPLASVEKPERILLVRANKTARRIFCFAKFSVQIASNTIFEAGWIASCSCVTTSNYQHNNFFQLFEKLPQNAVDRWMQTNSCFHFIFSPRYPRIALSLFFRYINEEFWNKHWNPSHSLAINHFPLVKLFSWIASLIETPAWPLKTLLSEEVWCFSSKDVEILCRRLPRHESQVGVELFNFFHPSLSDTDTRPLQEDKQINKTQAFEF